MIRKEHMPLLTIPVFGSNWAASKDDAASTSYTVSFLPNPEKLNFAHFFSKVQAVIRLCLIHRESVSIRGKQCGYISEGQVPASHQQPLMMTLRSSYYTENILFWEELPHAKSYLRWIRAQVRWHVAIFSPRQTLGDIRKYFRKARPIPSSFHFPYSNISSNAKRKQIWSHANTVATHNNLIIKVWKQLGKYHLGPFMPGRQNNYLNSSRWLSPLSKNTVILHSFICT